MSLSIARPLVLRRSAAQFTFSSRTALARRFESTATSKAAEAAKETASKASEAAKETATKASEAAKETASKASEAVKDTATKATETAKNTAEAAKNTAPKSTEAAKETVTKATETAKSTAEAAKNSAPKSTETAAKEAAAKATEAARETAAKATEAARETAAKAAQGLSRVTSAAGPAILGAARGLSGSLGKVGGRTGRFVAFVESQIPLVIYYARVGAELSKIVFRGQKMNPPSVDVFRSYFESAWKTVSNPSALLKSISAGATSSRALLQRFRGVSGGQLAASGVLVAELLGFFTVGEMVGRFKLVGYHGDTHAAHH